MAATEERLAAKCMRRSLRIVSVLTVLTTSIDAWARTSLSPIVILPRAYG